MASSQSNFSTGNAINYMLMKKTERENVRGLENKENVITKKESIVSDVTVKKVDARKSVPIVNVHNEDLNVDLPRKLSPNVLNVSENQSVGIAGSKVYSSQIYKSTSSIQSSSTFNTLHEGKFPIKSSRVELVWGCVKLGKNSTQEFSLRNQVDRKVRMQANIVGPGFRLLKDRSEMETLTSLVFVLRPMETRSFFVVFNPITLGATAGKISFSPIINGEVQKNKRQSILLYGYGGHSSLDIRHVAKDCNGKYWLSLGKLQYNNTLTHEFTIRNNGTLPAFFCLDAGFKGVYSVSILEAVPSEFVIKPLEEVTVTITYTPSVQDFRHCNRIEVLEVGYVKIISATEPIRHRIKKLHSKLQGSSSPVDNMVQRLVKPFKGETMTLDLQIIKESVAVLKELLRELIMKEITITLEQDPDCTLIGQIGDDNDTSMYQTLYQDQTVVHNPNVKICPVIQNDYIKVEPSSILITPPIKMEDLIIIYSLHKTSLAFRTLAEPSCINLKPQEGILFPDKTTLIKITYNSVHDKNESGTVLVYVENNVIEIPINIVKI